MLKFASSLLLLAILFKSFLQADPFLGEALEREMWANIQEQNFELLENHISTEFQSLHIDGIRNREQEFALLKEFKGYEVLLNNFKVTESQDSLIITYNRELRKSGDQKTTARHYSSCLSIWQNNGVWQWVTHCSLPSTEKKTPPDEKK